MKAILASLICAALFWNMILRPDPLRLASVREIRALHPSASALDVIFVGDGYTAGEEERFWNDVELFSRKLLSTRPFRWVAEHINVRGIFVPACDTGCDPSAEMNAVDTPLECTFDTLEGRMLTIGRPSALAKLLTLAGEVDLVFVMVNTPRYGGAGSVLRTVEVRGRPLPAPTFAARAPRSFHIALHELGHSFAGLTDNYADAEMADAHPLPGSGDLPYSNATLASRIDRSSRSSLARTLKWGHFLRLPGARQHRWLHAGGHYRDSGVYRPWPRCRMRDIDDPFCPVCTEAMARAILAACGEPWEHAAYHRAHPLWLWE